MGPVLHYSDTLNYFFAFCSAAKSGRTTAILTPRALLLFMSCWRCLWTYPLAPPSRYSLAPIPTRPRPSHAAGEKSLTHDCWCVLIDGLIDLRCVNLAISSLKGFPDTGKLVPPVIDSGAGFSSLCSVRASSLIIRRTLSVSS
jgi:hypothetical protein